MDTATGATRKTLGKKLKEIRYDILVRKKITIKYRTGTHMNVLQHEAPRRKYIYSRYYGVFSFLEPRNQKMIWSDKKLRKIVIQFCFADEQWGYSKYSE